jgi:uncharacterized protein YcaQ
MPGVSEALAALSADEARKLALWSQGLLGPRDRRGGPGAVLRRLGAVQLDTISVLARSHELVAYARLGPVPRDGVEAAYWSAAGAFEYWSHAASILPIADWPWYAMRRARYRAALSGPAAPRNAVLDALREGGPQTARQLGGARRGGDWWDWSPLKRAAEQLLAAGDVVCVTRRSWQRVYDLAERAIPEELRTHQPSDRDCKIALLQRAAGALGVGTLKDLADYHRQLPSRLRAVIDEAGLVPVTVTGWDEPAWADPDALQALEVGLPRTHRTTLLSPFDSLIWDRARTERVFGLAHRLEAYVPAPKRVYGYFAMPVLAGGRIVARVDPVRRDGALVGRTVTFERPRAVGSVARAMVEAAAWVGCTDVTVERVVPPESAAPLRAALTAAMRAR